MKVCHMAMSAIAISALLLVGCTDSTKEPTETSGTGHYGTIIRGGTIYDGSGSPGFVGDLAFAGDRIAAIGNLDNASADNEIDAVGKAVSPGFINVLSWASDSLLTDGRGTSDVLQGVTLEVFGEGRSQGPLNEAMKQALSEGQQSILWNTLGEYFDYHEAKGVSPNIASLVGAGTLRSHVMGHADRAPTAEELRAMQDLLREAMEEGALGLGSALMYAPGSFSTTDELVALSAVVAQYDGIYASHVRNLGDKVRDGIGELLEIARRSGVRAHVWHLIAAGQKNWDLLDGSIAQIEDARAGGLSITSDTHVYTAANTTLTATTPHWTRGGGMKQFAERLRDPAIREKIKAEMLGGSPGWENIYDTAGPENIVVQRVTNPASEQYVGQSITEIAQQLQQSPADTILDLLADNGGHVSAIYHIFSEENIRKKTAVPWLAFCSDSPAHTINDELKKTPEHPRAYGAFARVLGKYVREEKSLTLEEAIRRMTAYPAEFFRLKQRGMLKQNYFGDVVVFDPATIQDHATFEDPHQYATGVDHVFVNGVQVVAGGQHTGALPGRAVRGPGWSGWD